MVAFLKEHDTENAPKLFVAFLGINQFRRVGLRFVCWFYYGNTQRLTESCFMEKPGIEPATPGLQGIALIHYTTAASLKMPHCLRLNGSTMPSLEIFY